MSAPVVFVISSNWTFRTMVRAELREAGLVALGMETIEDAVEQLARNVPSVVVVDSLELTQAAQRELANLPQNTAILAVDSRITPVPALPSAEVLRRPVRVQEIVSRVLARVGHKAA